jgi:hypothetical protein
MTSDNKTSLYDFQWQALRTSLDFSNEESTRNSIERCKKYLEDYSDVNKVWRVLNLMAATRMGFSGSSKLIKSPDKLKDLQKRDEIVLGFREKLSQIYDKLKQNQQQLVVDDESKLRDDLKNASTDEFGRVYESLIHRYENSSRSQARPELKHYLEIMRDVLYNERNDQSQIEAYARRALKRLRKDHRENALNWDSPSLGE